MNRQKTVGRCRVSFQDDLVFALLDSDVVVHEREYLFHDNVLVLLRGREFSQSAWVDFDACFLLLELFELGCNIDFAVVFKHAGKSLLDLCAEEGKRGPQNGCLTETGKEH